MICTATELHTNKQLSLEKDSQKNLIDDTFEVNNPHGWSSVH